MTHEPHYTHPTTWYKVERREIETAEGPAAIYVPVHRVCELDARHTDGSPAVFATEAEAHEWCRANSPKTGWRR
jgi:hypothetical protein